MGAESFPQFEPLQEQARRLAERLADAAQHLHEEGTFPAAGLSDAVERFRLQDQQYRDELKRLLQETQLQTTGDLAHFSLPELKLHTQAVYLLKQIPELLHDYRSRLAESHVSEEVKQQLQQELTTFQQLLKQPALPLSDELVEFSAHQHPLQKQIEEACLQPPVQTEPEPPPPPVSYAALAAALPSPEPVQNNPDPEYLLFEEDLLPESEVSERKLTSLLFDPANVIASLPGSSEDLASDFIFDDIRADSRDKKILTSADLDASRTELEQPSARETAAEESSAETLQEPNIAETPFHMAEDSVFDELDELSDSPAQDDQSTAVEYLQQQLAAEISSIPARQWESEFAVSSPDSAAPAAEKSSAGEPTELDNVEQEWTPFADYTQIREYAGRAENAQNRFDRVSYLSRLIWEMVAQGEYSWAYQVSRCLFANVDKDLTIPAPPPWLLQLLILGDQVKFSSGRVAREFQSLAVEHRRDAMQLAETPDKPEAFLLRAALMRGAITTATSVSSDILRTFVIQPNQTQLYNYCSRIASFSTRATGLKLDQYFYRPGAASIEMEARSLRSQVASWKTSTFDKFLNYQVTTPLFARAYWSMQPASAVVRPEALRHWRAKQILQSHIIKILQPILGNQLKQNSAIESELRRLSQSVLLEQGNSQVIISEAESVTFSGRNLYNYVQQVVEFGSHWLILAASYPGMESVLVPQEVNELKEEIDRRQYAVFLELKQLEKSLNSHAHRAALTACRRSMDRIHQLFHPTEDVRLGELDPNCLLNAELLKIPGLILDDDWQAAVSPTTLEHQILSHLKRNSLSWEEAFDRQLDAGAYRSARSLLRLDLWTDRQRERLQTDLENRRQNNADSLKDLAERIRQQIRESQQIEILTAREAAHFQELVAQIEHRVPGEYRLDQLRSELIQIRQTLDSRRGLELKRMQERMSQLSQYDRREESPSVRSMPEPPSFSENSTTLPQTSAQENSPEKPSEDDWALDV